MKKDENEIIKITILRFNQKLANHLKVSVESDVRNHTEYDKMKNTDTTIIEVPKIGGFLLQNWVWKCNDKNKNVKNSKSHKINKIKQSITWHRGNKHTTDRKSFYVFRSELKQPRRKFLVQLRTNWYYSNRQN